MGYTIGQVKYFSVWNEPDQASSWRLGPTAAAGYNALYAAVAVAVKAVMPPGAKIGGPEAAHWPANKAYVAT